MNQVSQRRILGTNVTYHHFEDPIPPISIDSIRQIQQERRLAQDSKWQLRKNKVRTKVYRHVAKQLQRRVNVYFRLHKQAQKGKNYLRLTDFGFPLLNPICYYSPNEQAEILSEVVEDLQSVIEDTYGPEFVLEVQDSPYKISRVFTWIFYDIYAFYDDNENGWKDDEWSDTEIETNEIEMKPQRLNRRINPLDTDSESEAEIL